MKNVWFIRHAESEANAGLPTSFPEMISLTCKGIKQAKALTDLLNEKPDLIVTSKYIRTQQTAEPTINKFIDVPVEVWPLHEYDFLSPDQCINTTVDQRKPWVQEYWSRCEAIYVQGDGAESFLDFKSRIISCIKMLENNLNDFIVVFAHGHVIRAIWQYFITSSDTIDNTTMQYFRDKMAHLPVANAAIFKAAFDGNKWIVVDPRFEPPATY